MMKNIPREQVLQVVKQKGPTIPARIVKELGGDTFLVGAILSDLLANKLIKFSHIKLGGSPFYYTPEQKPKLALLSTHLNKEDQHTYALLKEQKVLKDEDQQPLVRVSLRNIKDFAKPVEVKIGQSQELFWKFFLVDNEEVKNIIKERYLKKPSPQARSVPETKTETQKEQTTPEPKQPEKKEQQPTTKTRQPKPKEAPKKKEKTEKQVSILKEEVQKGSFDEIVHTYFEKKNIEIVEKNRIRKTEIDYIIRIPSSIGTVEYYCKAKDKKRCNDGDLATAFIQGQNKKLPVLFLTTGTITKKAKDMLHKEFKGLVVNRL